MFRLDKIEERDNPEKDQKTTEIITGIEETKERKKKPSSRTPFEVP